MCIPSELISPNYKDYIEAGLLRRMSKILRMSVACAKDCIEQSGIAQPDSIVVGTGLGCLQDTEKFLNTFMTIEGLLPPTSFIQSTHNTIAGQISLSLGNHGYNMTHTQNTVSFEHALIDAMLLLREDDKNVLVGAADEHIGFLDTIAAGLNLPVQGNLSSGASFFVLSNERTGKSLARLSNVAVTGLVKDVEGGIGAFLAQNDLDSKSLDLVLFSGVDLNSSMAANRFARNNGMKAHKGIDYLQYAGIYPTASSFAMHYAIDWLCQNKNAQNVLIFNHLNRLNLGLTLIQSIET